MDTITKFVYAMGFLTIFAGLSLTIVSYFYDRPVDIAFFVATGIAMIAANWLRDSEGDTAKKKDVSRSVVEQNVGYVILGTFIFVGLVIIGIPIVATVLFLAQEEFEAVSEGIEVITGAIAHFGEAGGPTYYAFLLGVLYFLSSKTRPASNV